MRRLLVSGFLTVLSLASAMVAPGQTFRFKSITFSGYPAPPVELLKVSGLQQNAPVTQADMQAAAQRLGDTGLFADISFHFASDELHFDLKPAENSLPVAFDNFPWWDDKTLEAKLESQVPLYHGSFPLLSGMQDRLVAELTSMLAEMQITATVSATEHVDLLHHRTVAFHLDKPAVVVGAVSIAGAAPQWSDRLDRVAKAATGQDFFADSTIANLDLAVEQAYSEQGYLEAKVVDVARDAPVLDGDKVEVPLKLSVVEGQQFHLGQFAFATPVLMTPEDFVKAARLKAGDVVDGVRLRTTLKALNQPYLSRGYLNAAINAVPTFDRDRHSVDYSISVAPGDVSTMGDLEIATSDDALRAFVTKAWKLRRGQVFDGTYSFRFGAENKEQLDVLGGPAIAFQTTENMQTHVVDVLVSFPPRK